MTYCFSYFHPLPQRSSLLLHSPPSPRSCSWLFLCIIQVAHLRH
jgi:hypothetical protein